MRVYLQEGELCVRNRHRRLPSSTVPPSLPQPTTWIIAVHLRFVVKNTLFLLLSHLYKVFRTLQSVLSQPVSSMKSFSEQCSENQKKNAVEMPSEEARNAPGNGATVNAAPTREVGFLLILIQANTYFTRGNEHIFDVI